MSIRARTCRLTSPIVPQAVSPSDAGAGCVTCTPWSVPARRRHSRVPDSAQRMPFGTPQSTVAVQHSSRRAALDRYFLISSGTNSSPSPAARGGPRFAPDRISSMAFSLRTCRGSSHQRGAASAAESRARHVDDHPSPQGDEPASPSVHHFDGPPRRIRCVAESPSSTHLRLLHTVDSRQARTGGMAT